MNVNIIIRMIDNVKELQYQSKTTYEKKTEWIDRYKWVNYYQIPNTCDIEKSALSTVRLKLNGQDVEIKNIVVYNAVDTNNNIISSVIVSKNIRKNIALQRLQQRNAINLYVTLKDVSNSEITTIGDLIYFCTQ